MQFYVNGYKPGDPFVEDAHPSVAQRSDGLPDEVDVLIVGCGPAGLVLAAQLANFPDIRTAVVDRRDGPLAMGQADGVACRTVEMFEAFGLADRLVAEAYWVNEVCFWRLDPDDPTKITRTGRIRDAEEGVSEFPHVIVNQARMLAYLQDHMERSASRLRPFYGLEASGLEVDAGGASVTLQHLTTGGSSTVRARYTYSEERQAVAEELIDFDRKFSKMFSADGKGVDQEEFQRYFVAQGRFTAGVATRHAPSIITAEATDQHLAEGFQVGTNFHSAPVIRLADAKPVQLGHAARADGAWRIYVFADRDGSRARKLCEFLDSDASPIRRFTPAGADPDSVIDVRAVFQQGHRELAVDELPPVLLPRKGKFGLVDYEKVFCSAEIFELRGVDRESGCMVVVRPDQYVAHVLALHECGRLADFFAGFLID